MTRIGRAFTAKSATGSRDATTGGATGAAAGGAGDAEEPLDRIMSITRSRSSGEMLANAEFLIVIPAFVQKSIKILLSISSSLARAKIRIFKRESLVGNARPVVPACLQRQRVRPERYAQLPTPLARIHFSLNAIKFRPPLATSTPITENLASLEATVRLYLVRVMMTKLNFGLPTLIGTSYGLQCFPNRGVCLLSNQYDCTQQYLNCDGSTSTCRLSLQIHSIYRWSRFMPSLMTVICNNSVSFFTISTLRRFFAPPAPFSCGHPILAD